MYLFDNKQTIIVLCALLVYFKYTYICNTIIDVENRLKNQTLLKF